MRTALGLSITLSGTLSGTLSVALSLAPAFAQSTPPPPTDAPPTSPADAPPLPPPPPAPRSLPVGGSSVHWDTLALLLQRGIISQGDFDAATRDLRESMGARGPDTNTLVLGRWRTTLYGFVQADVMWHSTQSFNDFGSNFQVARPGTYAGDHGRFQWSIRDSRIGLRIQAPETRYLRVSGVFELDLLGPTGTPGSTITEASYFNNPNLRVRHAYLKLETPIVDVLFGQYWHLFGWQPYYFATVVQWPSLVGELFSRTAQLRVSKTFKTPYVQTELAVMAFRSPERDSGLPAGQAGLRIVFPKWTAWHTGYLTSTGLSAASIAVSGDLRRFTLPEFSATPKEAKSALGGGVSVSAYLPIIPAKAARKDNSLSLVGEFVTGAGISEMYVGLTGGVANAPLPNPTMATPAPTYTANIDAGLAVYDASGALRLPRWTNFLVGLEYYVPGVGGRLTLFSNFSRSYLHDADQLGAAAKVRRSEIFCNAGLFVDPSDALRFGVDYGRFDDEYADGVHAVNHAVQLTGFLFF